MRAAVFHSPGQPLSIETVSDPTPAASEVVIRVCRCGVCGTDLHRTEKNFRTYREGTIAGHEFSGEVVALGAGVTGVKVGDLVTALPYIGCNACRFCLDGFPAFCLSMRNIGTEFQTGAYAEYVVAGAPFTLKLPEGLSVDDGALIEPLAVGLRAATRAQIRPGTSVLILGAGPIGLAVAFWAKRAGAGRVAVQASSGRRAALAAQVGADLFIQPVEGMTAPEAAHAALGGPPEVVFECVGVPGMIDQAVRTVARRGRVMILGACFEPDHWTSVMGMSKEIDIRYSFVYDLREFQTCIDALERGAVEARSMITQTVSLTDLPEAFEALRGKANQCKVLVAP